MTEHIGKILLIVGGALLLAGLLIIVVSRFINLNELPGTIRIEKGNFRLFIPILGSIFLSVFLTIILNIITRLINR